MIGTIISTGLVILILAGLVWYLKWQEKKVREEIQESLNQMKEAYDERHPE